MSTSVYLIGDTSQTFVESSERIIKIKITNYLETGRQSRDISCW